MITPTLEIIWFLLPAMTANMAPVFAAHYHLFENLNRPLDRGVVLRGQPLLGPNKTVRGIIVGVTTAAATGVLQSAAHHIPAIQEISLIDYTAILPTIAIAALLGAAALAGDAIESFFKRRRGRPAGSPWRPFDQIDFVIAALIAGTFIAPITLTQTLSALVIVGFGSFAASHIGVRLKLKHSV